MTDEPRKRACWPVTPERVRTFLEVLEKTGSAQAAAAAATPWSKDRHGGLSTFRDHRRRDPEFSDAWDRALETATGRVESEVMRRAMTPVKRPVFSKGELVGEVEEYDNRLLLMLARRLNPEAWNEKRQLEVSGQVDHDHRHAVAVLQPRDILLLEPADRATFTALLGKIADARGDTTETEHEPARLSGPSR